MSTFRKTFNYDKNKLNTTFKTHKSLYPKKSEIPVRQEFINMAINSFGVGISINKKYWPLGFRRKFPLALQLTHDNFQQFTIWLNNWIDPQFPECAQLGQANNMYAAYFGSSQEFTIYWWEQFQFWFLREENRKINPLSLIFDPLSPRPRIYKKAEKSLFGILERNTEFQYGTVKRIIKAYKKSNM